MVQEGGHKEAKLKAKKQELVLAYNQKMGELQEASGSEVELKKQRDKVRDAAVALLESSVAGQR